MLGRNFLPTVKHLAEEKATESKGPCNRRHLRRQKQPVMQPKAFAPAASTSMFMFPPICPCQTTRAASFHLAWRLPAVPGPLRFLVIFSWLSGFHLLPFQARMLGGGGVMCKCVDLRVGGGVWGGLSPNKLRTSHFTSPQEINQGMNHSAGRRNTLCRVGSIFDSLRVFPDFLAH